MLIQAVPAAVYYLYIQMYGTTALGVGLLFDASDWRYWVLPVCSMSLGNVAFYAMWLRRYMVDESNKDYVRLALAKGVSESNIALRHIFRNAMVPLVQYIPSAFLNTVVGSIYIESLYSIPAWAACWSPASSATTTPWCRASCCCTPAWASSA